MAHLDQDEADKDASSHMITLIPVVQCLREQQCLYTKQHSRCQTVFPSLSFFFKQTPSIWVASISAIDCISFSLPFALLSWLYTQQPTVRGGFLNSLDSVRVLETEMQTAATVQPQDPSLTPYYVKLSSRICGCAKRCGCPPAAVSHFSVVSFRWD